MKRRILQFFYPLLWKTHRKDFSSQLWSQADLGSDPRLPPRTSWASSSSSIKWE